MDRILLTYVLTCFVGFLLLAISMSVELSIVDVECQVMGKYSTPFYLSIFFFYLFRLLFSLSTVLLMFSKISVTLEPPQFQ